MNKIFFLTQKNAIQSLFIISFVMIVFPMVFAFASSSPTISITSPTNGVTLNAATVTVTGIAADPVSGLQKVEVSVDGNAFSSATGTGSWSFTTTSLSDGPHAIIAKATGNDGPVSVTSIPIGSDAWNVAVNPSTNTLYAANQQSNSVSVINGATNAVTNTIPVAGFPFGVAVNPSTNTIYVSSANTNTVSVINGVTNTISATVSVGSVPLSVAVNPSTNTIYVANRDSNSISVIDGATNTVINTIAVGTNPWGVAVNPLTNTVYVTNSGSDSISVINGVTNTVISTFTVGALPRGVAVNPSTNTVYVVNQSSSVSIIDGATNEIISTVQIGSGGLFGVAVNPSTNTIYVDNSGSNSISIIDGTMNLAVSEIPVGSTPVGVAVNPSTNTIYAVNNHDNSISVIDGATSTANLAFASVSIIVDTHHITLPPTISPTITGTLGNNGWYTSDVTVSWSVTDPESTISSSTGCTPSTINTDTSGITFTCSATSAGGTSSQFVTIKRDATAPTITAPSSINLISSTPVSMPLGTPTVSDNLDPSPIVTNNAPTSFASGSTTTVTWTAKDLAGNSASDTQQVTIQTPAQAITGLINAINGMNLPTGEQTSLGATLKNIDTSNPSSCGKLNAFVSKVNNDLSNGKLTISQTNTLLSQANAIKAVIGCK